jgi:hypothetical protein
LTVVLVVEEVPVQMDIRVVEVVIRVVVLVISGPGGGGGSYISSRAIDVLKEVNHSVAFGDGKVNIKLL